MPDNDDYTRPTQASARELAARLIHRCDPDVPPLPSAAVPGGTAERTGIAAGISTTARDGFAPRQCMAIYDDFLATYRLASLLHGLDDQFLEYVNAPDIWPVRHVRRNYLLGAHRMLTAAGLADPTHVLESVRLEMPPVPGLSPKRRDTPWEAQSIPTTSDEVLLLRCSARLTTSRDEHRPAAALAITTTGAQAGETAAAAWNHLLRDGDAFTAVELTGYHRRNAASGRGRAPRIVPLDAWERRALRNWHDEAGPMPGSTRLIVYGGRRDPSSQSAINSVHKAIALVREAAALDHLPVATPFGLAQWSAAWAIAHQGLDKAAVLHGATPAELVRRLGLYE